MGEGGYGSDETNQFDDLFYDILKEPSVTFKTVFQVKSVTRLSTILEGSDGKFYIGMWGKFQTFEQALDAMDEIVLHPLYVIPTYLDPRFLVVVAEKINKLIKVFRKNDFDDEWIKAWSIFLNRKCNYLESKNRYEFIVFAPAKKIYFPNRLGKQNEALNLKIIELAEYISNVMNAYTSKGTSYFTNPEILKQHGVYSYNLLKYWNVILGWSQDSSKQRYEFFRPIPLDEFKKSEFLEINEFDKGKPSIIDYEPYEKVKYDDSKETTDSDRLCDNLQPLFKKSIESYFRYHQLVEFGIKDEQAIYFSGIHNKVHYELAKFLVDNYTCLDNFDEI